VTVTTICITSWNGKALPIAKEKWNAFVTDPECLAIRAETEKDGQLVSHITNLILSPTAYSRMR
jgi:hypothetical protein